MGRQHSPAEGSQIWIKWDLNGCLCCPPPTQRSHSMTFRIPGQIYDSCIHWFVPFALFAMASISLFRSHFTKVYPPPFFFSLFFFFFSFCCWLGLIPAHKSQLLPTLKSLWPQSKVSCPAPGVVPFTSAVGPSNGASSLQESAPACSSPHSWDDH